MITPEQLKEILQKKPVNTEETEVKEVFALLGFKIKEYHKASLSPSQKYEVHYKRFYISAIQVDDSRCLSVSNEFINFGNDVHGLSFGGIDTFLQLIQTMTIIVAPKMGAGYNGEISFDPDRSEYSVDQFNEILEVLNKVLFSAD